MDACLRPGAFIKLTRHLTFGDIIVGEGAIVFLISVPSESDDTTSLHGLDALILYDERLIRVPDWWLKKNSIVLVG